MISVFCYTSDKERERERERAPASVDYKTLPQLCSNWTRHIQVNVKAKLDSTSIGRAIFSRIWKDERQLQEFLNSKHAYIPVGCAIFNRLYF
jgi:hypothetical protein